MNAVFISLEGLLVPELIGLRTIEPSGQGLRLAIFLGQLGVGYRPPYADGRIAPQNARFGLGIPKPGNQILDVHLLRYCAKSACKAGGRVYLDRIVMSEGASVPMPERGRSLAQVDGD